MQYGSIQISGERISTKDAKEFCEALDANKIKILALRECGISKKNFMRLMVSVGYCQSLVHMNLNHCGITCEERVDMLAAALNINKSLSALLLHGNHFGTEGLTQIVKSVILHPNLTCIDVGDCDLGDRGLKYICELLPANITRPGLQELVLSGNPRITPRAWEKFSVALSACSTLRALYIDFNNVGDVAGKMLVVSAAGHPTLSILDMEACELSDEVGRLLLHLVQKYPTTLTHILLEDNKISCDTIMNIRIALGESDSEASSDDMEYCTAKPAVNSQSEMIKSLNSNRLPCINGLSEQNEKLTGGATFESIKRQKREVSCEKKTKVEATTDDECSNSNSGEISLDISISNRKPNQCTKLKSKQPQPAETERNISEVSTADDGSTLELSIRRKSRFRSSSASEEEYPKPLGKRKNAPTPPSRPDMRSRLPSIPEQKGETSTVCTQTTNRRTRRSPPAKPNPLPDLKIKETINSQTQTCTRKEINDLEDGSEGLRQDIQKPGCDYSSKKSSKTTGIDTESCSGKSSLAASCQTNCQPLPPFGTRPEMRARKRKYRPLGGLDASLTARTCIGQLVEVGDACQRTSEPGISRKDVGTRVCYVKAGRRSTSWTAEHESPNRERKRRKSSSRSPWCGGGSDCSRKRKMSESPEYMKLQKLRKRILQEKMELNSRRNTEVVVLSTGGSSQKNSKQNSDIVSGANSRRQTIYIDVPNRNMPNSKSDTDLTQKLKGKHLSNAWTAEVA